MKIEIQDQYIESFKEFLTRKGLRVTNQRMAIFGAAFSCDNHFTAEDLLEQARKLDDSVSRATVYRASWITKSLPFFETTRYRFQNGIP